MNTQYDLCIVGAGMAGATIAAFLAPKGIKIALIDRNFNEKNRIVGELLQPGAVASLKKMGLEHLLAGFDAQDVYGYALLNGDDRFTVPYSESGGGIKGVGLRNGKFLQKIREQALKHDCVEQIQGAVTELCEDENRVISGVKYKEKRSGAIKTVHARLTITSDGFFSNFRQHLTKNKKSVTSYFIGIILKNCRLPYPNYGHVFLSGPTPFIAYPIASGETRVLIDFPGATPPKKATIHEHLQKNVAPYIPESLKSYYDAAVEEDKFKIMPNHYMAAKPIVRKGAVMLGDSLNMRHPLTGGGLTAVFADVHLLGTLLLSMPDFNNVERIHRNVEKYYRERQPMNANVNILANALYGVMSNELLKHAVYNYIKKGGENAQVPISILAGLNRNHKTLIRCFFSVAFLGAIDLLRESLMNFPKASRILLDAFNIIKPLAKNEMPLASIFKIGSISQ